MPRCGLANCVSGFPFDQTRWRRWSEPGGPRHRASHSSETQKNPRPEICPSGWPTAPATGIDTHGLDRVSSGGAPWLRPCGTRVPGRRAPATTAHPSGKRPKIKRTLTPRRRSHGNVLEQSAFHAWHVMACFMSRSSVILDKSGGKWATGNVCGWMWRKEIKKGQKKI